MYLFFLFISPFNIFYPFVFHFMLFCFFTWLINCFNADNFCLENGEWVSSSWLSGLTPSSTLSNGCGRPTSFLVLGWCCPLPRPSAHDGLMSLHLLLAGFPSVKTPTPILTHQDPQPL
jgi:hypothetical protein